MEKININLQLTKEALDNLNKSFVAAKKNNMIPSHFTFNDFLVELLTSFSKSPNLNLNNKNFTEMLNKLKNAFGDIDFSNMFGFEEKKEEEEKKKEENINEEEVLN